MIRLRDQDVFETFAERTAGAGIAGAYLCYGAALFPLAAMTIAHSHKVGKNLHTVESDTRGAGRASSLPDGVIPNHRLLVSDVGVQHHTNAVAWSKGKQRLGDHQMPRDQLQTIPLGHHGHDELRLL